jgi:hypothetical protein
VQGETAQAEHGHAQAQQAAISDAMQIAEQGGLAIGLARRQ